MNELQTLEALLDELLNGIENLLSSGEILSDEFQGILAQELEITTNRIDFLREQNNIPPPIGKIEQEEAAVAEQISGVPVQQTPAIPQKIPPLEAAPHESSNINAFKYNPEREELYVKFQDKYPGTNGPIYAYQGVPSYIFDIFARGAVAPKTSGRNAWHRWKRGVAPSHGASMWALIRAGGFPYQKVS